LYFSPLISVYDISVFLAATDLADLPMTNDDENVPHGVDIESFWKAEGRKATRVLLRRGDSAQAQAAAKAAAKYVLTYCKHNIDVLVFLLT
jgi:hypothetical protein